MQRRHPHRIHRRLIHVRTLFEKVLVHLRLTEEYRQCKWRKTICRRLVDRDLSGIE